MKQVVWVVLSFLVAPFVQAASFDCAKAATKVEKLICSNAELSRLDEQMSAAYQAALKDVKHTDYIKRLQREWLQVRNADSTSIEIAKLYYEMQLSILNIPIATTPAGKPVAIRGGQSATLLQNGKVLVAGGWIDKDNPDVTVRIEPDVDDRAELYDPGTNRFTATGPLRLPRRNHSAILLSGGKVLVSGGALPTFGNPANSLELYDPVSGTFSTTDLKSSIGVAADYPPTLLTTGKLLFAGWNRGRVGSAERYDPATGRFAPTGNLITERQGHTATLLPNGKVLIAGGQNEHNNYVNQSELYDPVAGKFTGTGVMNINHSLHIAMLLPNGKVLVAGGNSDLGDPHTTELYDPATGQFVTAGKLIITQIRRALLLENGKVLIIGQNSVGGDRNNISLRSEVPCLELYDPARGTSVLVGKLPWKSLDTATLLKNGKVLLMGEGKAELYDPAVTNK